MKLFWRIFSNLCSRIPTTNIIVFCSFPDYTDNAYAFCRYLASKKVDEKYKFVWLISDKSRVEEIRHRLVNDSINSDAISRLTIKGIWMFIRARYIFTTHGLFSTIKLTQHKDKIITLWHGMPLKHLGASERPDNASAPNSNYTIATNDFFQKIMSEAFACPIDQVLVVGQPRCDLLMEKTVWFSLQNIDTKKYNQIGIWLPTYRRSIIGDIRTDGEYRDKSISFLNEEMLLRLDAFLLKTNTLLLVKIHPMDAIQHCEFQGFKSLIFIKPQEFHSQLYPLLGSCDFMLTDYSSVFVDYQITRKPMAFVMDDIEAYKNSRGFYFEDLEKALPGPILKSYEELTNFITAPKITQGISYNKYYDNKSSERLAHALKLI